MLTELALGWAEAAAPGAARMLAPGERLADAVQGVFSRQDGPLLLAAAETPRLARRHAEMALEDLADGAAVSVGPGMDGGWYLIALSAPHAAVLGLLDLDSEQEVMGRLLGAAAQTGLEVGMLRMERMLRTSRDVLAVRADPLTPAILRRALG